MKDDAGRAVLPLFLAALGLLFLFAVRHVLLPFLLSALVAYAATPAVRRLELAGLRRRAAIAVLYAGLAVAFAVGGWFGVPALANEASQLRVRAPLYAARVLPALRAARIGELAVGEAAASWLEEHKGQLVAEAARLAPEAATGLLQAGMYLFIVPFLSFFMMAASGEALTAVLAACPSRHVEQMLNLVFALDETIGRYIRGVMVDAALVGSMTVVGLWALGLNYAVWLGVLAGAMNVIPYLGLGLSAAAAVIVGFAQWGQPGAVGAVLLVFAGVKLCDDLVLQPLIMRKAVHLNPVLVVFVVSCGAELGGLLGLVFAVPTACVLRLLVSTALEWQASEEAAAPRAAAVANRSPVLT